MITYVLDYMEYKSHKVLTPYEGTSMLLDRIHQPCLQTKHEDQVFPNGVEFHNSTYAVSYANRI